MNLNPTLVHYGVLGLAILLETIGTSLLQASKQFTKPGITVLMALCYLASFYLLTIALKTIPVGVAYATWSSLGIVLISVIGFLVFKQKLDLPAVIGIGFIIAGVTIINLFSKSAHH
jgi:small multidrug resistance pump